MRRSYESGVLVEAGLGELLEALGEIAIQRRGRRLGDVEEDSHRVEFRVRGFTFGELDGGDAQRPDISLRRQRQSEQRLLMRKAIKRLD